MQILYLYTNMRLLHNPNACSEEHKFADWLLQIGQGIDLAPYFLLTQLNNQGVSRR